MITSEAVPFSKSGGLADVASALSIALANLDNRVSILMPAYGFIDLKEFSKPITEFEVELNSKKKKVSIVKKTLKNVDYYALIHPYFSQRKGIYGDTSFTPYADNFERYMLLSKSVFPLCKELDLKIDILHAHDWTTGLVPYLLKQSKDKYFSKCKSVFTIHNLAYQGVFSRLEALKASIKLDEEIFEGNSVDKKINMLRAGLIYSDYITTVSPTYAKEIQTKEFGCNLDHILKERQSDLFGIINGIDYDEWNPKTDEFFTPHYEDKDLNGKKELKKEVQKLFNLEVNENIPLISMISRFAEQKGFYELLDGENALETIVKNEDVQVLIIGTGDENIQNRLTELSEKYDNLSVNIMFSNKYAHMIEGASDFFLMPSRYEPCGLNQLYSLRYGTLPIARKTGGLADSIFDIGEYPNEGTGFLFSQLKSHDIIETIRRALNIYYNDKKTLNDMIKRSMNSDFTWNKSALSYLKIYSKGLS